MSERSHFPTRQAIDFENVMMISRTVKQLRPQPGFPTSFQLVRIVGCGLYHADKQSFRMASPLGRLSRSWA